MAVVMSARQLRSLAMQDYPDWAGQIEFGEAEATPRTEWKGGQIRRYTEYAVSLRHPGLEDSRTVVARTPGGFGKKLDSLLEAWDKQWRVARRVVGVRTVSPLRRGSTRGTMYVQVVYLDDVRDASEVDISASIRHNGLRKPHRGERTLQHAYLYRWPFAHKPQRGDFVIGSGTLAFVTRLSRSGSDWHGYTVDLDAFVGCNATTHTRQQLVDLVQKYPRGSLDDEYYSVRFPNR